MRHELTADGSAIRLRPVREDDAPFIVELRSQPDLARYLHPGARDTAAQLAWLDAYFARPGDWYLVAERHDGAAEGLVSLYDAHDGAAELGRWILRPGSLAAPESLLLAYRLAFETLRLDRVHCRTVAANAAVVSLHDRTGAARTGRAVAFDLGGRTEPAVEHEVTRAAWPVVEARLAPIAAQAARLMCR